MMTQVGLTENDTRAAMAVGKKLIVLAEADDYELCVPEDGSRPKDSFWRRKEVPSLVSIVRMTSSTSSQSEAALPEEPPSALVIPEPAVPEPVIEPVKLRLVRDKYEVPDKLERGEKICIDCGFPYPLTGFYTNSSTKDGRQSRCKECDKKRRTEYNQGLHVKASEQDNHERDASRKRASEVVQASGKAPAYVYKGVSGGFLIHGYVK
jgi:hypothetical protein